MTIDAQINVHIRTNAFLDITHSRLTSADVIALHPAALADPLLQLFFHHGSRADTELLVTTMDELVDAILQIREGALRRLVDIPVDAPPEDYEAIEATLGDRVHPEACWYTMKATVAERVEHYTTRKPHCDGFALATFDEAEAAGLDGTGRDGDPRFPYKVADLTT